MNRGGKILYYLVLFHFGLQTIQGQESHDFVIGDKLQFEQFSINQGLSHVGVTSVLQDNSGFLWVGTYDGLNRFDGLNFEIFKHNPDNPATLTNNRIHAIYEDDKERLWIGTEGGISILDLKTYGFNKLRLPGELSDNSLSVLGILNIYRNEIWIFTTEYGLLRFTDEGEYLLGTDLATFRISGKPIINDAIKLNENECIICTSRGLLRYYVDQNEFLPLFRGKIGNTKTIKRINDTFYAGTVNGVAVIKYENNDLSLDKTILKNLDINYILFDKSENIWIGTNGNGLYYGQNNHHHFSFVQYSDIPLSENSLGAERISCIYTDDLNNVWLSSYHHGLIKVNNRTKGFKTIRNNDRFPNKAASNYTTCLTETEGERVLVGFRGEGLRLFDPRDNKFHKLPFEAGPIKNSSVAGAFTDSRGILWILTWDGLFRVLPGGRIPEEIPFPEGLVSRLSCVDMVEDKFSRLWLGTRSGLYRIIINDDLGIDDISKDQNEFLGTDDIQSLFYDEESEELWIGTHHSGLFLIPFQEKVSDGQAYDLRNYTVENTEETGLKSNFISSIYKSARGDYYIGTEGGGISLVTGKFPQLKFTTFSEKDGLLNTSVKSILEDANGNLWIGTNNGFFQFDCESRNFVMYTYRDGIQSNAFNYPCLKKDDGSLIFGGTDGFTYFQPGDIQKDLDPPRVIFDDFYLSYKQVLPGTAYGNYNILPVRLAYLDTLILRHNENIFSVKIIPLHYLDATNNRIKYKLENYDDEWIDSDAYSNIASYSKLKPGHYTLKAVASNSDDIWTPEPKEISIIIKPPIWQTKLSFVFYFLLFSLVVYLAFKIISRITRLRSELRIEIIEKEKETELHEAKLRFFTNISHEFKTPISLILGPAQWLSEKLTDNPQLSQKVKLISNQAKYLLNLMEQLLEFRKAEKDTLKLECCKSNIIEFIEKIKDSFEIYAQQKDITFEMEYSHRFIPIWFDEKKMEKIINNILSNAFKYTDPGGVISIHIKETRQNNERKGVLIQISDTGKGISKEALPKIFDRFYQENEHMGGSGIGLSLTKSLVEIHKGKMWVESEEGSGSSFFLEFLSGEDHLKDEDKSELHNLLKDPQLSDVFLDLADIDVTIKKAEEIFSRTNSASKKKLLIVEDHLELRNFIREIFQENFRVLLAGNGIEALEIVENEFPIAVISDVRMPEMDGIELCKRIKTNQSYSHIPVILLTSKDSIENRLDGLKTGADAYLTKPFQINHLMVQLNNVLENREIIYDRFKNGLPLDLNEFSISSMESEFLEKVMSIVKNHLEDPGFDSIQFAKEMYMNRTQFYRKMKAITNLTPAEFLRNYRLTIAAELISRERLNVSEVIYRVGMKSRSNFTRCFKEKYGMNPHDYKTSVSY